LVSAPAEDVPGATRVLFSRERDHLIGRYFFPVTEPAPADFSAFIQKWTGSTNPDRLLHFFDFAAGSHDPTFEHTLVFAHPGLQRIVGNKAVLRDLWKKTEPMAVKLAGPEGAASLQKRLGL